MKEGMTVAYQNPFTVKARQHERRNRSLDRLFGRTPLVDPTRATLPLSQRDNAVLAHDLTAAAIVNEGSRALAEHDGLCASTVCRQPIKSSAKVWSPAGDRARVYHFGCRP